MAQTGSVTMTPEEFLAAYPKVEAWIIAGVNRLVAGSNPARGASYY
jgi:hypothetical protein